MTPLDRHCVHSVSILNQGRLRYIKRLQNMSKPEFIMFQGVLPTLMKHKRLLEMLPEYSGVRSL